MWYTLAQLFKQSIFNSLKLLDVAVDEKQTQTKSYCRSQ